MSIATIEEVLFYLDAYAANTQKNRGRVPFAIKASIVDQIVATGSIDTERFLNAVSVREEMLSGDDYRAFIDCQRDSEVTYDGFVETDGVTRKWTGRWNYRDGIGKTELGPIFDETAADSFPR